MIFVVATLDKVCTLEEAPAYVVSPRSLLLPFLMLSTLQNKWLGMLFRHQRVQFTTLKVAGRFSCQKLSSYPMTAVFTENSLGIGKNFVAIFLEIQYVSSGSLFTMCVNSTKISGAGFPFVEVKQIPPCSKALTFCVLNLWKQFPPIYMEEMFR